MDSYNFTYKDVLKRYERIINKPSRFEIRFLATILLIITIVNITSLCFASEEWESVSTSSMNGIRATSNSNFFTSYDGTNGLAYFPIEKGYIYRFSVLTDFTNSRIVVGSSDLPALNGSYTLLYTDLQNEGDTYSFIANGDDFAFISISPFVVSSQILVERQKLENMNGAVSDLVENVGISQIWDIFDTGIGFVGVVVLVAFGIFLIVLAIKKVSKGKSEF